MAYPCGFCKGGSVAGFRYAERSKTQLRPRRPAFHYLLLLSPAAVSGDGSRKKPVRETPGRSPKRISVPANLIRHYAGARAFADQRAEEKQRVASAAGIEAASITRDARKEEAHFEEPAFVEVRGCDERGSPILAAAVLRLQCVERCKEEGKTAIHACESCERAAGGACERMAVEQFLVLCAG